MNVSSGLAHVVVIGGGRWARVALRELDRVVDPGAAFTVVSRSAPSLMEGWLTSSRLSRTCSLVTVPDRIPPSDGSGIAIVVNRPSQHVAAARLMVDLGYHVLIEKPVATDPFSIRELVERADRRGLVLAAGLPFLFAPVIREFKRRLPFAVGQLSGLDIVWQDPVVEQRHGETKRPDPSISVVMDGIPHAWSLLRALFGMDCPLAMTLTGISKGGTEVEVALTVASAQGTLYLSRSAPHRRRLLRLRAGEKTVLLDFTEDTAQMQICGGERIEMAGRDAGGGSLAGEYRFFVERAFSRNVAAPPPHPADLATTLEHVDMSCALASELSSFQRDLVRRSMENGTLNSDADALAALRELLAEPFIAAQVIRYGSDDALTRAISAVAGTVCGRD